MEEDKLVRFGKTATLFFIITSFFLLILFWGKLPPQVPLFYSRPWGEEQLGKPLELLILPGTSFLFYLGAALICKFYSLEKLLLRIINTGVALFSFLSFLTLLKIITLAI